MAMEKSESIASLSEALAKAQGAFGPLKRSRTVDYMSKKGLKIKYSYAELADVLDVIRKPLTDNGLAILQPASIADGHVVVTTMLTHASGEWISSDMSMDCTDTTPQEQGSALTYARRYGLSALIGIASEDDDDATIAQHGKEGAHKPEHRPTEPTADDNYWCAEHKTHWFKKGNMRGYAHKIEGTDKWCNMPVLPVKKKVIAQDTLEDLFPDDTDDAPDSRQEAPQTALPPTDGPTTIPELLKRAYDEYGMKPPAVAKEAAVESTARIQDVPRVWAQIQARHPQRQVPLTT